MKLRPWSLSPLLLFAASAAGAQDTDPARVLKVSPAAEPVPALKYRLIPRSSDLNPGNAAPLYLRIRHELSDPAPLKKIDELALALDKPLAEFPKEEVRQLVDSFAGRLKQLEFGARRQTCDWGFSLPEQRSDAVNILLPDTQEMRRWARLLALKARTEMAEGKTDEAVRTLETGLAFGRHVSDNPFLIGSLVGVAIENVMLLRVEELIQMPGSPNLYWALTALPRPLIDMRGALELEERLGEDLVPEINEVDKPQSDAEWSVLLTKMHGNMRRLAGTVVPMPEGLAKFRNMDLAAFREATLPPAKKRLGSRSDMTEDQMIAVYLAAEFREARDEVFKATHLPYREAVRVATHAETRLVTLKNGPLAPFVELFPSLANVRRAGLRLERSVAALRVVEALRLHAASHQGVFPKSLSEIDEVPVPEDPATGGSFGYQIDGAAAVLTAPLIDDVPKTGVNYRIEVQR